MPAGTDTATPVAARGSCLCGRHQFETQGHPRFVSHCHCRACRRALASPLATYVGFPAEQVSFDGRAGTALVPAYASSAGVQRGFCKSCGTALFYASDRWPGETHLFRGNFEQPTDFEPTAHVFFDEREQDFDCFDDLPRYGSGSSTAPLAWGAKPAFRILFLCTGNSARSVLAEAIVNLADARLGERRVRAHSAGSQPTGRVNPGALALLEDQLFRLGGVRSKSWDEFTVPAAPPMDLVITLCDSAAAESCPLFPGPAEKRHWGLPDPASGAATFPDSYRRIETLVEGLFAELGVALVQGH